MIFNLHKDEPNTIWDKFDCIILVHLNYISVTSLYWK